MFLHIIKCTERVSLSKRLLADSHKLGTALAVAASWLRRAQLSLSAFLPVRLSLRPHSFGGLLTAVSGHHSAVRSVVQHYDAHRCWCLPASSCDPW